jgi:alcohol dehydrogenase (cytochrome c)
LGFVASHSNEEVAQLVRTGQLDRGMPRFDFNDEEMRALQTYLRGLIAGMVLPQAGRGGGGRGGVPRFPHPATLQLEDGRTLAGTLTSESQFSSTLLTR